MSEQKLSPDSGWVNAGTFDLRIVRDDPIGTFRVRPVAPTTPRQFKDCDGDTWTEVEPGWLRLTERANGSAIYPSTYRVSIEDVSGDHGPLTEIRPDVDVRALLAGVLEELAEKSWDARSLYDLFQGKARELREGNASVRDE